MAIAADQTQSWLDQHAAAPLIGQGLGWLDSLRTAALQRFAESGLPGVRDEQWRYTNLRALKSQLYMHTMPGFSNVSVAACSRPRLVFVNGHYAAELSSLNEGIQGVTFVDLEQALAQQTLPMQDYFSQTLPIEQHGFTELNTAYCHGGYVIHLASGAVAGKVLEVLFLSTAADHQTPANISHTRNFIIAEPNSQCRVIERHVGDADSVYLHNTVTEVIAGENAHIDHYKIQQESSQAFHIGGVFMQQSSNAQVTTHNIALGSLVARNDVNTSLNGEGGHIEMNGLVFGRGRQHVDNHTEVHHIVANCSSDEHYKSILDDHSRSVFRGRIVVAQDAQLTNADQQNNNLLLSRDAEADSKPQLEIYADDVTCSHGATVGQLDPNSLFYLRSRGIDEQSAIALLTFAFANEIVERIKIDSVREELTQLIAGALLSGMEELL